MLSCGVVSPLVDCLMVTYCGVALSVETSHVMVSSCQTKSWCCCIVVSWCGDILCCCLMSCGVETSHGVKTSQVVVMYCGLVLWLYGIFWLHHVSWHCLWCLVVLCLVQVKKSNINEYFRKIQTNSYQVCILCWSHMKEIDLLSFSHMDWVFIHKNILSLAWDVMNYD